MRCRGEPVVRTLGRLLIACVALAVLKAVAAALLLALVIALIWAACLYPREMLGFIAYCGIMGVVSAHPMAAIAVISFAVVCAQLTKNSDEPP